MLNGTRRKRNSRKIGPGVEKVKPGDKVVMHWRKSSGVDSEFPKYQSKHGTVGSGLITTFSEFSVVENRITKVNTDLDFSYLVCLVVQLLPVWGS